MRLLWSNISFRANVLIVLKTRKCLEAFESSSFGNGGREDDQMAPNVSKRFLLKVSLKKRKSIIFSAFYFRSFFGAPRKKSDWFLSLGASWCKQDISRIDFKPQTQIIFFPAKIVFGHIEQSSRRVTLVKQHRTKIDFRWDEENGNASCYQQWPLCYIMTVVIQ